MPHQTAYIIALDQTQAALAVLQPLRKESTNIEEICECLEVAETKLLEQIGKNILNKPTDNGTTENQ